MDVTTKGTAAPDAHATKAFSKPTTFNTPKASRKSKSSQTKSTSKTARTTAAAPFNGHKTLEMPATRSSETASPYLIECTKIETPNDRDELRRLVQGELAKIRDT